MLRGLTDSCWQREEREKSNLVCNIHWAAVQKELARESLTHNTNTLLTQPSPSISWNSQGDAESSESNSWSSISLSSSKTNSCGGEGEMFPDCGFSRSVERKSEERRKEMSFSGPPPRAPRPSRAA